MHLGLMGALLANLVQVSFSISGLNAQNAKLNVQTWVVRSGTTQMRGIMEPFGIGRPTRQEAGLPAERSDARP